MKTDVNAVFCEAIEPYAGSSEGLAPPHLRRVPTGAPRSTVEQIDAAIARARASAKPAAVVELVDDRIALRRAWLKERDRVRSRRAAATGVSKSN